MSLRRWTLSPAEVIRVREAGGPLAEVDPAKLAGMSIAAVEVDGQLVAYWVVWKALHLEPLWIRADHRQDPGVVRGLLQETLALAEASGEPAGFVVIEPENFDTVRPYAERLGFQEAPGKLYYLVLEPAVAPVRG